MTKSRNKEMFYSESVKAKLNGACSSSLDRFSIKHSCGLRFNSMSDHITIFNPTQFNELSQPGRALRVKPA